MQKAAKNNMQLGVVIPAHNEASVIGACLGSVLSTDGDTPPLFVVVAANGCRDRTVEIASSYEVAFEKRGWKLSVLDLPVAGKIHALNCADDEIGNISRIYLDADIEVEPSLIRQLWGVLYDDHPVYASGKMVVVPPRSIVSRLYLHAWKKTGFMTGVAQGAGVFAVNMAGRAKWQSLPDIIADDTFVRTLFDPAERVEVKACYHWPLPEGFGNLVRARRRQDAGMRQLQALYPDQLKNEAKPRNQIWTVLLTHPLAFLTYVAVRVAARLKRNSNSWLRGR